MLLVLLTTRQLCNETGCAIPIAQTASNTETPIMTTCDTVKIKKLVMKECISRSRCRYSCMGNAK